MPLTKPTSEQVEFLNAVNLPGNLAIVGALTVGSVNASAVTGPGTIPLGGIIMWSGSTVPTGWALCNGQIVNSIQTPNLVDKFVIGGLSYSAGAWQTTVTGANTPQGGNKDSVLVAHTHSDTFAVSNTLAIATGGAHTHTVTMHNTGITSGARIQRINSHDINSAVASPPSSSDGAHTHTLTGSVSFSGSIASAGTGAGTNENLPPYFALAYIMRVL